MYCFSTYESPIGTMALASDGDRLVGVWTGLQKFQANPLSLKAVEKNGCPVFMTVKKWLDRYFAGEQTDISALPLAPEGNEFRQSVWRILCGIPYGGLVTYGEIAKKIAQETGKAKMSARAIGGAVGHNPIPVIIPCHRVIGANGNLTGYSEGIETKIKLLELEGVDMSRLSLPKRSTPNT